VHYAYIEKIKTQKVIGYYHSLLYPNLIVIDKLNGGISDALNAGINAASSYYTLTIDADTVIDNNELSRMLRYIVTKPTVSAWGANVRVANGCIIGQNGITTIGLPRSYLGVSQVVEYLRVFFIGRMGWEPFGGALIISGAFSLFETTFLKQSHGFTYKIPPSILGEDLELVVRFKKERAYNNQSPQTGFIAEPVCWTEVPENLRVLARQRTRWHMAVFYSLWLHKAMLFNPKYGLAGFIHYPFFLFGELLAPIVECLGYLVILASFLLSISTPIYILSFIAVTIGLTFFLNVTSCLIEVIFFRKYFAFPLILRLLWYCLIENFGYRQLTLYWRLRSLWHFFKKKHSHSK
jgi:cellulose synthase/poly-beta-1,6-N-acetylglucosamine synthase-like glycosyltransferase